MTVQSRKEVGCLPEKGLFTTDFARLDVNNGGGVYTGWLSIHLAGVSRY